MNNIVKIISLILSVIIGFFTYPISFIPSNYSEVFDVMTGEYSENSITFNGKKSEIHTAGNVSFNDDGTVSVFNEMKIIFDNSSCDWFNYFGLAYTSDSYIKGSLSYRSGTKEMSEDFFLEPADDGSVFYSFIDNSLDRKKANAVLSLTFRPLNTESARLSLNGFSIFNRAVPDREVYIENENYKLGVDLLWGGALSYLEDKNSDVEAVRIDGEIKVDSNASARYNTEAVNKNVNLINRYDPGRLVQQSYYGIGSAPYEPGVFMGNTWSYNPVQGGNQFGDSSKIVDLKVTEKSLYIKCRPLDWAKPKEHITPSYMEATYEFIGNSVHVSCRFVDFSGYNNTEVRTQEIPAFYCIEPLNNFVYYAGNNPWNNEKLTVVDDLIFWPDAGYPNFTSLECWSAFVGEFDDSFGIGIYVPDETRFLTGVYSRGTTTETDPSVSGATSYIAVTKDMLLKDFNPVEYEFYLSTGNSAEIRNNFSMIK